MLAHTTGVTKYFLGATHYLANELTKAKYYLFGVLDVCSFTDAIYVTQACGILGFIYLSEGYPEKAESVTQQVVDSAWEMQDKYSPEIRKALRVELALRLGRVDEARRLSIGVDFESLPPTWFLYVPQLTHMKLLLADGTDRSLEKARSRLVEMDQTMRSVNRKCVRIDVLGLLALVCHKMGAREAALEALQDALMLAEPGGWVRNFVDLGAPMTELLERLNQVSPGHSYAQWVLEACRAEARTDSGADSDGKKTSRQPEETNGAILSRREIEILPLLGEGMSNKEIAARLHVSPVTIKTHLQNIYRKLNVRNRVEALKKSRETDLVIQD
jgi:LuxR family maltose regulon positive regulatory protein